MDFTYCLYVDESPNLFFQCRTFPWSLNSPFHGLHIQFMINISLDYLIDTSHVLHPKLTLSCVLSQLMANHSFSCPGQNSWSKSWILSLSPSLLPWPRQTDRQTDKLYLNDQQIFFAVFLSVFNLNPTLFTIFATIIFYLDYSNNDLL